MIRRYIYLLPLLLLLLAGSCTVKTNNLAAEVYTIKDAYWNLVSLEGEDVVLSQADRTAFIRFQEKENDVHGYTGCNKFFGEYILDEDSQSLRLSELSTTRMACPDLVRENKIMDVLRRTQSYRITDNLLLLYEGDKVVATFITGNPQSIDNEVPEDVDVDLDSVTIY